MRIKFWDRLLAALSGLLIVLAAVGLFVFGIGVLPLKLDLSVLEGPFALWQRVVMVVISLLLLALGLHGILLLFHRRREKGFVIQQTELGDMSISMNAMESMVKKCVDAHSELVVNSTRIHHSRDGIVVEIKITLQSGVNIPLTVNALQKQIKQYITSCSGVDVHQVRVMVETNTAKLAAPQPAPVAYTRQEAPEEPLESEEAKPESGAGRWFHHAEEPESYTAPIEEETPPAAAPEAENAQEPVPAQEEAADAQPVDVPADEAAAEVEADMEAPEGEEEKE
ncbi:MAG: alkaline shock response membrane anchor protein AmaP [Clostridiales bacterium]|nr:alkaline shock response membrane anchor protein AmaP [Clostridiales bacterium]